MTTRACFLNKLRGTGLISCLTSGKNLMKEVNAYSFVPLLQSAIKLWGRVRAHPKRRLSRKLRDRHGTSLQRIRLLIGRRCHEQGKDKKT
jgi:hypothetical protein